MEGGDAPRLAAVEHFSEHSPFPECRSFQPATATVAMAGMGAAPEEARLPSYVLLPGEPDSEDFHMQMSYLPFKGLRSSLELDK